MATSTIKYPVHYPVGCTICTSTNTDPSSIYGGTWSLVMREFKRQSLTSTSPATTYFSLDSTNADSYSGLVIVLGEQNVFIRISIKTKVALSDTSYSLGTFNFPSFGVNTTSDAVTHYFTGFGESANGMCMGYVGSSGDLQITDVVTRTSSGTIAAGTEMKFCIHLMIPYSYMLDSFCDKFYWRRTA